MPAAALRDSRRRVHPRGSGQWTVGGWGVPTADCLLPTAYCLLPTAYDNQLEELRLDPDRMHIGRFADDFADLELDPITLEAGDRKSAPEAELEDALGPEIVLVPQPLGNADDTHQIACSHWSLTVIVRRGAR